MEIVKELTTLENQALDALCKMLSTWREGEPGYSCIDGADITRALRWPPKTTSGVISSLCKKGYVETSDDGDFKGILYVKWGKIPENFGRDIN